ncbi:Uncharacterised protein [Shigella sonnei]|nr:Uncharacterised protein [Shigella sonnei]
MAMVMPSPPGPAEWKKIIDPNNPKDSQGLVVASAPNDSNAKVTTANPYIDCRRVPSRWRINEPIIPPVTPQRAFTTAEPVNAPVSPPLIIPANVRGR